MRNKIFMILAMFIFTLNLSVYASEDVGDKQYIIDEIDILSEDTFSELNSRFEAISQKYGYDIVGIIAEYTSGDIFDYTENYYLDSGFTKDGMVLLIDDFNGDYCIYTLGKFEKTIDDDALDYIEDSILPHLEDEDFVETMRTFADVGEELYELDSKGKVYREPFNWLPSILVALGVGFVVAFIVTGNMKKQLNNVQKQERASTYVRSGSMNVTESGDLFLYHHISRTPRPKSSSGGSGGRSGGGKSGGGRSGSFR